MKDADIVRTITPAEPAPEILLRRNAWDWLLIFEQNERTVFDTIINTLNLPTKSNNSVLKPLGNIPTETIKIMPLDAYLAENNIAAQDVKYIWIGTEGFEPQVILGAKNLLAENPAPIFMECNLTAWDNFGHFEDMIQLLATRYTHFILFSGGNETANRNETLYPLDALRTIERPKNALGQVGDIFFIKAGAIA